MLYLKRSVRGPTTTCTGIYNRVVNGDIDIGFSFDLIGLVRHSPGRSVTKRVEKAKPGVEMEDADNVRARQAQAQRDQRDRPKFLPSSAKL